MEKAKRIPYGVSNFVDVVERNQYYVDKTMYLPLLEDQPDSLFFIRPRRFGKSIFLSMLRAVLRPVAKRQLRETLREPVDRKSSYSFAGKISSAFFRLL